MEPQTTLTALGKMAESEIGKTSGNQLLEITGLSSKARLKKAGSRLAGASALGVSPDDAK